jgi:chemotaxis response regulator CheB
MVRLVLADDEEAMRRVLRRLLEAVPGLEIVGEAADGREAVELVHTSAPDILLLDCDMPHVDGPSAAELILSRGPQTRILLHSSGASDQKHAQAAALGLTILDKSLLRDTVRLIEVVAAEMRPTLEPLVLLAIADHGGDGVLIVGAARRSRSTTGSPHQCFASRYPRSGSHSRLCTSACASSTSTDCHVASKSFHSRARSAPAWRRTPR